MLTLLQLWLFDCFVASQLWCLAKLFPLMIGHFIVENEEHWGNVLLLLTIADFLFVPIISQDEPYLKDVIQQHHKKFIDKLQLSRSFTTLFIFHKEYYGMYVCMYKIYTVRL